MIKLIINLFIFVFLVSCQISHINNIQDVSIQNISPKINLLNNNDNKKQIEKNVNILKYIVGKSYYIEGVKYTPEENYTYNQIGLASFYNKELHNKKTINNDYNKVTELLARHKTLPIPSIVKVTNLDNGLSITLKVIDRHDDNTSIIDVSRKSAQLLKFYKNKIARVRVEILSDPSKQMKIVIQSMNESSFNDTIISAPTEKVSITNMGSEIFDKTNLDKSTPIEIGFTEVENKKLFLKVFAFNSYNDAKQLFDELEFDYKFTTQNDNNSYSLIIGPLENNEANNLVLSLISRGYKNNEFFLQ